MNRLAYKLYTIIAVAVVSLAVLVGASWLGTSEMATAGRTLHAVSATSLKTLSRIEIAQQRLSSLVARAPTERNLARQAQVRAEFDTVMEQTFTQIDAYRERSSDEVAETLGRLTEAFNAMHEAAIEVFGYSEQFAQDQANEVLAGAFNEAGQDVHVGRLLSSTVRVTMCTSGSPRSRAAR